MNCVAVAPGGGSAHKLYDGRPAGAISQKNPFSHRSESTSNGKRRDISPGVHSYSKNLDSMRIAEGTDLFARDADRILSI